MTTRNRNIKLVKCHNLLLKYVVFVLNKQQTTNSNCFYYTMLSAAASDLLHPEQYDLLYRPESKYSIKRRWSWYLKCHLITNAFENLTFPSSSNTHTHTGHTHKDSTHTYIHQLLYVSTWMLLFSHHLCLCNNRVRNRS